jgi:nitrilase
VSADLTALACQIVIPEIRKPVERDAHVQAACERISSQLETRRADLVVLPELSTVSHSRATFERLDELAESLDGPSFAAFAELTRAHETSVVFSMPRIDGDLVKIAQLVVGSDGELIGYYDKLHAAQFGASMEKEFFVRGEQLLTFDCRGVTVAPIICYGMRFPELARSLALGHGAQLILRCGAYARDESFHSWHSFGTTRAMENQVYGLSLNRAGDLYGDSIFCGPWVDEQHLPTRFPAHAESLAYVEVDLARIESVRRRYTFLADRLADYDDLPSGSS